MAHTQPQPQPTLLLSAPHLPLATALTSTVPLPALAVIQWCVFENRNRSEVMALYNASGYGTHYTPSGVYKIMRKYGPIWFNEQQVRRPWGLYFSEEKAELIRRGWGKDDLVMAGAGGVADEMVVDPLAGWVAGPGKKRVRRSRVVRFEEEDDESTAGASSAESSRSESPVSDHRSFESPSVEDHPVVHQDIGVPIPEELKVAIQEKHNEWLEANKTGRADIADPLEEQLADLERQAMEGRYTHALETASKRKPQAATSSAASDGPPNSAQDATNEVEIIEDSDEIEGGQSAKKSKTTARPASRTQEKAKLVRLLADKQWLSGRNTFIFNFDRKTKDPGQRRRSLRSKWAIQMRRFSGSRFKVHRASMQHWSFIRDALVAVALEVPLTLRGHGAD
ncbi:predicted protein [Pyrenophora tritici-repentis Pt-1C-BFP]|uniref:Uncharacterized protein n=1 Tax=Pyrenophora tritici-repentis (strain Pt-1C-BFP) TaxID=426418 RepID=B2WKZ6_PYRTR|nr:uncharacterized protein PTRG_10656 [Pyrenophora tritici-repentis Pt-1C-BFP]EDU43706.1 predicted protein [Pyrenophora tritici-repentis Pt-1C-BFP]